MRRFQLRWFLLLTLLATYVLPAAAETARRPGMLHTWAGSFDLKHGPLEIPDELRSQPGLEHSSRRYFVVMLSPAHVDAKRLDDLREGIAARGGAVVGEMAIASLVARLHDEEARRFVRTHPGVLVMEPYHPAFKLSPEVAHLRAADTAASCVPIELDVALFPGETATDVASAVRALGGSILDLFPSQLRLSLDPQRLAELAALDAVMAVFAHVPAHVLGMEIAATLQTGTSFSARPFHAVGVDGSGSGLPGTSKQVLMMLDNGIQLDAGELSQTSVLPGFDTPHSRKVRFLGSTTSFGGNADGAGCDAVAQGGFTHGHVMASVALGNASTVPPAYGAPWPPFKGRLLDGVAPGAVLVFYDAQVTPALGLCGDPMEDELSPGDLYSPPAGGSLGDAYAPWFGARTFSFSWGAPANIYSSNSIDVDQFLFDKRDAMLFQAAGNDGPAPGSINTPGTAKNAVVVGATYGPHPTLDQNDRWPLSSVGPVNGSGGRVAPILMAPGADLPAPDAREAYACTSGDNDHAGPVMCNVIEGLEGTSVAAAAASGAGLLVRDYFQQGFYPDGTSTDPGNGVDQVLNVSGALVKALLVASADWVGDGNAPGANLTKAYRFNNEQGYGRIQLTKALKLNSWIGSREGVIVVDGGIPGGVASLALPGAIDTTVPGGQFVQFPVLDDSQELRVALVWIDSPGNALINDLDLTLSAPVRPFPVGVRVYFGNYFTDDNNRDGVIAAGEDCGGINLAPLGALDASPWSLPRCPNSITDNRNPVEAIFLSADADADGDRDPDFNQIPLGLWTVGVSSPGTGLNPAQRYALVITGGVTVGGAIVWNIGPHGRPDSFAPLDSTCAQQVQLKVLEVDQAEDPAAGLTPAEVSSRVRVQVVDASTQQVVDEESGFALTQPVADILRFESAFLTPVVDDGPATGNGLIEVQDGNILRAIYDDETSGVPVTAEQKDATFEIVCTPTPGETGDVLVESFDSSTGELSISYTAACGAADHTIVYGPLSDVSSYGYSGQDCSIGANGFYDAFNAGSGSYFFLVVGNDGGSVEGSYGRNDRGKERPEQIADPVCSFTQDLSLSCN